MIKFYKVYYDDVCGIEREEVVQAVSPEDAMHTLLNNGFYSNLDQVFACGLCHENGDDFTMQEYMNSRET